MKIYKDLEVITGREIDNEKKPYFVTFKEHPVKNATIVYYLHECQLQEVIKEMSDDKDQRMNSVLVQWLSTVLPTILNVDIINLNYFKK